MKKEKNSSYLIYNIASLDIIARKWLENLFHEESWI